VGGEEKKKFPRKKPIWAEERKNKGQLEFATLVSPGTGRDEKGAPTSAPSIRIGALLVGAGSLWHEGCRNS